MPSNEKIDFSKAQKIIFSSPLDKIASKLAGRFVKIKEKEYMQFEHILDNQAFHENVLIDDLPDFFDEKIKKYKRADIFLADFAYMAFNKNGEISFHKTKSITPSPQISDHNRKKNYIINEGDHIPVLIDLGIFTKERKIVNSMYDKFKQINRFIELFADMSEKLDEIYKKRGRIEVLDFGCGKSYLTFILYHYFVNIKKFPEECINIIGVDLKEKVVGECNELAKKYKYKSLRFECADIRGYTPKFRPDAMVSLHGCDTATDYALYNAIKWQSELIFVAPCCEHEINAQIDIASMANILKYGIIKERFSALLTNAIRCNILEIENYKTELLEFVDIAHSPKNLLIRAKKTESNADKSKIRRELEETLQKFKTGQTLYNLLDPIQNISPPPR